MDPFEALISNPLTGTGDNQMGADVNPGDGAGDTTGLMGMLKSMSPDSAGGMDMNKLKDLMKDPQFMMALQMMMSKKQPDMMSMASQMYGNKPGGLGGLGGM
jgi:hypothetical protein